MRGTFSHCARRAVPGLMKIMHQFCFFFLASPFFFFLLLKRKQVERVLTIVSKPAGSGWSHASSGRLLTAFRAVAHSVSPVFRDFIVGILHRMCQKGTGVLWVCVRQEGDGKTTSEAILWMLRVQTIRVCAMAAKHTLYVVIQFFLICTNMFKVFSSFFCCVLD